MAMSMKINTKPVMRRRRLRGNSAFCSMDVIREQFVSGIGESVSFVKLNTPKEGN